MKKVVSLVLWIVIGVFLSTSSYGQNDPLDVLVPNRAVKVTHQIGGEDKLIVSVIDDQENPLRGLTLADFVVQMGTRKAKVLSVEPLATSEEIGLNVILVLDNSYSMKMRKAIDSLLSALEEFYGIIRPLDNIYAVVFDPDAQVKVMGRTLRTKTLQSREVAELRDFLIKSFDAGLSNETFLREGMLAAVDIAAKMPEKQNKIIVVFSDGEDLNSDFGPTTVVTEAAKVPNLRVYAVDYMPNKDMDPFLASFTGSHGGAIWKAKSSKELVPIFKAFSTALRHQYVVSYRFLDPPDGSIDLFPKQLDVEMLTLLDGSPAQGQIFFEVGQSRIPDWYTLFKGWGEAQGFDEGRLADAVGRYRNVLNIIGNRLEKNLEARVYVTGYHAGMDVEQGDVGLAEKRAESVKQYLSQVWRVDDSRMIVEGKNLPEKAGALQVPGATAEARRVEVRFEDAAMQEELSTEFIVTPGAGSGVTFRPLIVSEWGIARWELFVEGDGVPILSMHDVQDLPLVHSVSIHDLGKEKLITLNRLNGRIKVVDNNGDAFETTTADVPIVVSKRNVLDSLIPPTHGILAMAPADLTIEEVTTIDSSPLLNYIFFEEGRSEIGSPYALFTSSGQTETFDETALKGSMEKYAYGLNIVGKRLISNPDAQITIVGCNSGKETEEGRLDLSSSRAEAIRAYLKYIWGIDFGRMAVKARGIPEFPSTSRLPEGRAENQRAEIYTEAPTILDTVQSTYVEEMSNTEAVTVSPKISVGFGVKQWRVDLKGDGTVLASTTGTGGLTPTVLFRLKEVGLKTVSQHQKLTAEIEVVDERGKRFAVGSPSPTGVKFIKREERLAQKLGYRVIEKYALILFDYDSAEIRGRNEVIVGRIVERVKQLPEASVTIVGHTDNIGDEGYNLKLSERRARAVYDKMRAAGMAVSENVTFAGAGPHNPLYDNALPEGRAFNRTVMVEIGYDKRD